MFDVFNEDIELLIKRGMSNLYWYKADLQKAWLRSNVDTNICKELFNRKNSEGKSLTKRELMDELYLEFRTSDINKRIDVSRNFVRILINHTNFTKQDRKHEVHIAENCALKLKQVVSNQNKERKEKEKLKEM